MQDFYLSIASLIASSVLGVCAVSIALQQWRLSRYRFRLDLFEKRYKVYEAAGRFLSIILSHANFSDEDLRAYNIGTMDTVFLFPQSINEYLKVIRKRALDMRLFQDQFETKPVGDERSKLVEKNHAEIKWLNEQLLQLAKVFAPYLGFSAMK